MDNFIAELKSEHKELLEMLEGFKKGQGITAPGWKEKLFAAKNLFLKHLKEEDEKLYPALLKVSEKDELLNKIVTRFTQEMKKVSEKTILFLEKYASVSQGSDFIKDFAQLEILLKSRIEQEEKVLYEEYLKAQKQ
jgi:hemerythrin-like domain-containing protein